MFSSIWSTVTGATSYILMAVILAVTVLAGAFWIRAKGAEHKVAMLAIDKERLELSVDAMKIVVDGQRDGIVELESTNEVLRKQAAELATLIEEIRNAPKSASGPISPVLLRLLQRLDGVRKQPRKARASHAVRHGKRPE